MQFSESWLRSFVNPGMDTGTLAHTLTMAGLEVEETRPVAPPFEGVVTARIVDAQVHPDADRLLVCTVDDGSGAPVQVVCGAPNARAGMGVALARVGARLPGGMEIGAVSMRGVSSQGMLCSARELGLSQDHEGLLDLGEDIVPGSDLRAALDLDDTVFTIKLTPNRADCLSMLGVAREVAALTGCELEHPASQPVAATRSDRLPVRLQAPDLCGRFAGRIVRGVNARASTPDWMKRRLERAGQRPISILVDISNYIMLELGQPTHVFDLHHLGDDLEVRWGRTGETLELLNGQTIDLDENLGVIASAGVPVSLAGIMGGEPTAVTLDTTDIYIEAAFWHPEAIMGRARRLKFASEASHRFERGVDFESVTRNLERMSRLVLDLCGGEAGPVDDQVLALPAREPVSMRLQRCTRVLGIPVADEEVARIFSSLGFGFHREEGAFVVQPPSYRFDIALEEDLIEEVARVHGFDRIPALPPIAPATMRSAPETVRGPHAVRELMAGLDYQEVINYAFVEEQWEDRYAGNAHPLRLLNPIASHLAVMRSSLMGGLLANVRHNIKHRQSRVRVFELGRVFLRDPGSPAGDLELAGVRQPQRLGAAAFGPSADEQWGLPARLVDFFDMKRDLENLLGARAPDLVCVADTHPALHPGRSARLELGGEPLGWLGELHPRWVQDYELPSAPVLFEVDASLLSVMPMPHLQEIARQPVVVRDLAVWVDNGVSYGELMGTLVQAIASDPALGLVRDIRLFDVWRDTSGQASANEKSMAFRFTLQDPESTLLEATVEACSRKLLDVLAQAHGARLRA